MNIIVCIKQVPGTAKVEIDPINGTLKRDGIPSKMNPFDLYALESAMRLRARFGGYVTALTMGPPQAETVLREAFMMGVDDAVLLSDRKFGGADVLATSYALSQGIRKIGGFDLIICGKQTTDGDTAQVGSEIAEFLDIPHITCVTKFSELSANGKVLELEADVPLYSLAVRMQLPCLVTVEKGIYEPRLPSYRRKLATKDKKITTYTFADMPDQNPMHYGLNGSPTQVKRIFPPAPATGNEKWEGTGEELADRLFQLLQDRKYLNEVR